MYSCIQNVQSLVKALYVQMTSNLSTNYKIFSLPYINLKGTVMGRCVNEMKYCDT